MLFYWNFWVLIGWWYWVKIFAWTYVILTALCSLLLMNHAKASDIMIAKWRCTDVIQYWAGVLCSLTLYRPRRQFDGRIDERIRVWDRVLLAGSFRWRPLWGQCQRGFGLLKAADKSPCWTRWSCCSASESYQVTIKFRQVIFLIPCLCF